MRRYARICSLVAVSALIAGIALAPASFAQARATPERANPRIAAPQAARAVDMYIRIEGIDGEATDGAHRDWIEVQSWSWGATNSSARQPAPIGNGPGSLTLAKTVDKSSPKLSEACTGGRSLGQVVVHVRASGGYNEYVMDDARVRSCSQSSSGDRPTENITLNFGKVESSSSPGGGDPDLPVVTGR